MSACGDLTRDELCEAVWVLAHFRSNADESAFEESVYGFGAAILVGDRTALATAKRLAIADTARILAAETAKPVHYSTGLHVEDFEDEAPRMPAWVTAERLISAGHHAGDHIGPGWERPWVDPVFGPKIVVKIPRDGWDGDPDAAVERFARAIMAALAGGE